MKIKMKNVVFAYLVFLILMTTFFVIYNIAGFSILQKTGNAYYLSENGLPSIKDIDEPMPKEMSSINLAFWLVNLIGLILVLFYVRTWAKESEELHELRLKQAKMRNKTRKKPI